MYEGEFENPAAGPAPRQSTCLTGHRSEQMLGQSEGHEPMPPCGALVGEAAHLPLGGVDEGALGGAAYREAVVCARVLPDLDVGTAALP